MTRFVFCTLASLLPDTVHPEDSPGVLMFVNPKSRENVTQGVTEPLPLLWQCHVHVGNLLKKQKQIRAKQEKQKSPSSRCVEFFDSGGRRAHRSNHPGYEDYVCVRRAIVRG